MKKKVKEIILNFENCETCKLDTSMFKHLIIQKICTNLTINCYQYSDGNIQKTKSCNYFSITINKKGLKQKCLYSKHLKKRIDFNDIISIKLIYDNNKFEEIYVPWNDKSDYINEYQENLFDISGNLIININRSIEKN